MQAFTSLSTDILEAYRNLAGEMTLSDSVSRNNLLGRRIQFLMEASEGRLRLNDLNQEQAILLSETLLDSIALQMATGGCSNVFESPQIFDASLLGSRKELRARFHESDDAQMDWHFQTLVQGWAANESLSPVKDLRDDHRFKGIRVCDFCVTKKDGRNELLECKRFHPLDNPGNSVVVAVDKITARLPGAIEQLLQTTKILGKEVCDLHLLIDLTAYESTPHLSVHGDVKVEVSGFQAAEISQILEKLAPECSDLDRLTLCWHTPIKIDGLFRSTIQNSKAISLAQNKATMLDYKGWTVEAYPISDSEYSELRVSDTARSLVWIVTSYHNHHSPETFYDVGAVESLIS